MKGLDRTQLKLIAICAMVCDHAAWGFVEFMSPLGQVMHVIGRLTLPIMCFFIAEGFRYTSSKKGYIIRMAVFSVVAVLPFYLFFHELYGYRQNIIFDLLLGLLLLAVLESRHLRFWGKLMLGACLFGISIVIGGWIIMPMLYILVFYYVKGFRRQAAWICGLTVTLEVFLIGAVELNRVWHFSHYDWPWYDKLYFLGFMLPLFLLRYYNGEKGKDFISKYFFYLFYPTHFLVLAAVRALIQGCTIYEIYVALQVIAFMVCLGILMMVLWVKPSRGQTGTLLLVAASCIYTFGFLVEIISGNVGGFYAATLVQYFGECLLMIGFTLFVGEMCHREIPPVVYAVESLCGIVIMWMLFSTKVNHIFYTSIGISEEGPFSRLVLEYGWGFDAFVIYLVIVCVTCFAICIQGIRESRGIERKRILCTAAAILCPWIPNFIRDTGITGGYEVPCLGILGAVVLVGLALIKYGYFDSLALAGENALRHGQEGIMVINSNHIITYYNQRMQEMFGQLALKQNAYNNRILEDIFEGRLNTLELKGRIYEMRVEALKEGGYVQGHMLWMLDITKHHQMLVQISNLAHKDALTGINNRSHFTDLVEEYLEQGGGGSLFMMDLDNFKQINDRFGHQAGDETLVKFAEVLLAQGDDLILCRIGGDEFCLFFKGATDPMELEALAERIAAGFRDKMAGEEYDGVTSVSIGIARILEASDRNFEKLYSNADRALYIAKNRNKNTWYMLA